MSAAEASSALAGFVFLLAVAAAWRQGGFWPTEAAILGLLSLGAAAACVVAPPDRRSAVVLVALALFASWWLLRSVAAGAGTEFLPVVGLVGGRCAGLAVRLEAAT